MTIDTQDALAERLERIEARSAIADTIHEYARNVRHDTPEGCPQLFAEDGVFEVRDGHPSSGAFTVRTLLEGRAAVREYLLRGKGQPHPVPLIHNLMIAVEGDTATATSVMEAQVFGTSHKVQGEYRDTLRRVDGRWLFARRIYTIYSAASTV